MSNNQGSQINVQYYTSPPVTNEELNTLFAASWPAHRWRDFSPVLQRSLAYVGAYEQNKLVGFVNLAWDGGLHAFILDTTVHPAARRQGIGQALVECAATAAQAHGIEWLHVDYEPHLQAFYRQCGFQPTAAGIRRLII